MSVMGSLISFIFYCASAVFFMGVGQYTQISSTEKTFKQEVLVKWAGSDKEKKTHIKRFEFACFMGSIIGRTDDGLKKTMSITDCAKTDDFDVFIPMLNESGQGITDYSWPLSLIIEDGEKKER